MVWVGNFSGAPARTTPGAVGDRRSIFCDELVGDAVIDLGAIDIELHEPATGGLAFADGAVDVVNGRFLKVKAELLGVGSPACHQRGDERDERNERKFSSQHLPSEVVRRNFLPPMRVPPSPFFASVDSRGILTSMKTEVSITSTPTERARLPERRLGVWED